MYSNSCLMQDYFEENFLQQQSIRITEREDLKLLTPCSEDVPKVDFDDFFLLVTRFESMQYPVFRDQGLYLENETELVYEINIDLSDFQSIGTIYCFGVIPNDFSQKEINVQIYEN